MNLFLLFCVIGAGTFLLRLSFIYLFGRVEAPTWLAQVLPYIPPAVLSALVAPAIVAPDGAVDLTPNNPRFYAGLCALVAASLFKNIVATIVTGLAALWVLTALGLGA